MSYRCIGCGFWTGPRATHWINEAGLCRSCDPATVPGASPAAPVALVAPAPPPTPAAITRVAVAPDARHTEGPRLGIVAALVLTVVMFCLTTLPVQPRAVATGASTVPSSTPGNPNAGCRQQGQVVGGPYDATCDGSPSDNGNSQVVPPGRPCAGCVGNADNQQPPGQMPGGSDGNAGFECDGNAGIGQGNPAHTSCTPGGATPTITPSVTPSITPTVTPSVTPSITPTVTPTVTPSITPTVTPTVTPSITPTVTPTPRVTPSVSPSTRASATPRSDPSPGPTVRPGQIDATPGSGVPVEAGTKPAEGSPRSPRVEGIRREVKPGRPGAVLGVRLSAAPTNPTVRSDVQGAAMTEAEVLPLTGLPVLRWLVAAFALMVAGSVLVRTGAQRTR